jgi:hypothetical protein
MNHPLSTAAETYNSLTSRLSKVNQKELLYNFLRNSLLTIITFSLLAFLLILFEAAFRFGTGVRAVFYWGFISTFVTTITFFLFNFIFKRTGLISSFEPVSYSKKVGRNYVHIQDKLSNSLSLYKNLSADNKTVFSGELIGADIVKTGKITDNVELDSFIPFKRLNRYLYVIAGIWVLFIASFLIFPSEIYGSMNRIINYQYNFIDNEYGIYFEVHPGNIEIPQGESMEITIFVKSNREDLKIDEIDFFTKEVTHDGREIISDAKELEMNSEGNFNTALENIQSGVIYFAEYKGIRSDEYTITVSNHPIIKKFNITINPPEATGLPSKTLEENEGNIFCPEGSSVFFTLESNKELSGAGINLNENFLSFEVDESSARGTITVNESGSYKFYLRGTDGIESKNESLYSIKVMSDEAPKITIIEPGESSYILKGEKEILLRARISDDYGFSKLVLGYRKISASGGVASSQNFIIENVPVINLNATSLEVPYIWNISRPGLRSGERIEYYMEVTDNTGKSTRSEIRTIQFKSLSEALKENEVQTKELQADLKSVYDQFQDVRKDLQELKKNQNNEELGLNEQQNKNLENKLDNFQKNLNSTQQKLEKSMNELQQNQMLSEKTLEEYMKLQEMFNKINTPELQDMLKKLREALKKNNPDELREAMKNFKFDEEAFKKYLEQAMELMKKIENLQKFGELTQKLDEIAKQQEELKKQTENTDQNNKQSLDNLSQKQKEVKDKLDKFKDELQKLIENMQSMQDKMDSGDLEDLMKKMNQKQTDNKMQKSSDQLQKGEKSNSEDTQQDIMDDLNEMNDNMMDALSNMIDSESMNDKMMSKMKDIQKQLEEMSKKQQELRDKTDQLNKGDQDAFQQNSGDQKNLQKQLSGSIDDLMNMTKQGMQMSPEMGKELGNAFNKMDKAGEDLDSQNKENASQNQGNAKQSLDNAAKMLADMLGQMGMKGKGDSQSPGQGKMSQLMQQLADLIGQQQGLNSKMGQMGKAGQDGKEGSQSQEEMERRSQMDRLRVEQESIRKSLEQLNEELKKEQERSGEKLLGDMNQVQKEMQEIIKDLSEYNVDEKTVEKQNRILSRMLDARLSQREKDFEPKRESKPGQNITRTSPPEIILSGPNSFNALKEDYLRLQKEGYTEDYEALITKYLMELRKSGER